MAYTIRNPEGMYFVTLTVVEWVDAFTNKRYKQTIMDSLMYCQKEKGLVYAWCLLSNHLHIIIRAKEGFYLADILRDLKKFTSKKIVSQIQEEPESRRDWMMYRFENYAGLGGLLEVNDCVKNAGPAMRVANALQHCRIQPTANTYHTEMKNLNCKI